MSHSPPASTKRFLSIAMLLGGCAIALPGLAQEQNEFPGRRVGGGTRGGCAIDASGVVALHPENNLGLTQRATPSLYLAVPESSDDYAVTFFLLDDTDAILYETTLEAGNKDELVGVQVPSDILKAGEHYPWYFLVTCEGVNPAAGVVVEGWLQQVMFEAPLTDVDNEPSIEQIQAYQAAGLWSDAIALTAELISSNPEDAAYQAQWFNLLAELELDTAIEELLPVRLPNAME
ncbi:MAG: DUF928 domain-containing protein [Leptolyngbyaceae cyanobacterium]